MKFVRSIILCLLTLIWVSISNTAFAAPMYYTFTTTNLIVDSGHGMLKTFLGLEYIFLVDRELSGYQKYSDGNLGVYNDFVESNSGAIEAHDWFFTDLISGNYVPGNAETMPASWLAENNYGVEYLKTTLLWEPTARVINFTGGGMYDFSLVQQETFGLTPLDLSIGSYWELYDAGGVADERLIYSRFQVQLTKISDTAPVPEPSTMILLGGGIAGLAFWKRKKSA